MLNLIIGSKVVISVDKELSLNEKRKEIQNEKATVIFINSDINEPWFTVRFDNEELNTYHGDSPFVFYEEDFELAKEMS